jgi:transketolase
MKIEQQSINTIRFLAADAVEQAASGHPGTPMGAAPIAYVLWNSFLRHSPNHPNWINRDRFVLSSGHGSMLLYSLLYLTGYGLTIDDLRNFRQYKSLTPGHPEIHLTPGVEMTTGPLGQGFASAVGMAIAEAHLGARFNKPGLPPLIDHYTYVLVSDGDLMEGISSEAASLAGHLKLGKLIVLYDDNQVSMEGPTELAFTEDRIARFAAFGWHTQFVGDVLDLEAIELALKNAQAESSRPSLIAIRSTIGYGAPTKQGKASSHAGALGEQELRQAKQNLGWMAAEPFYVPEEVVEHFHLAKELGEQCVSNWNEIYRCVYKSIPRGARRIRPHDAWRVTCRLGDESTIF